MTYELDLTNPVLAYMFGFIQSDGHMRGTNDSNGMVSVEIMSTDADILNTFKSIDPQTTINQKATRTRTSNR